ncbi:MAG: hypothetical protein HOO93_04930 [Methyloglobulus sp.]|nr:hypothetical protein [Methyloglobulus sp.]
MKHKTTHVVICGATQAGVTTKTEDIMALFPTGRVIQVDECPELKLDVNRCQKQTKTVMSRA